MFKVMSKMIANNVQSNVIMSRVYLKYFQSYTRNIFQNHPIPHTFQIIIFVPGEQEMNMMATYLDNMFGNDTSILFIHANLLSNDLAKLYQHNRKKIIISTDVGESFLATLHADMIIDCGTIHSPDEDLSYKLTWISKQNVMFRRKNTDNYILLQSETNYEDFPDNIVPQTNVAYDIARLSKYGLDPRIILQSIVSEQQIYEGIKFVKKISLYNVPLFCEKLPLGIKKIGDVLPFTK